MDKIRVELHFYGRVQGVGFRYWATVQAKVFHLTGWAKNEFDGSVTVQAQGTPLQIQQFKDEMDHGKNRYIRVDRITEEQIPLQPEERDFDTRY